jgi:hypothetical protein
MIPGDQILESGFEQIHVPRIASEGFDELIRAAAQCLRLTGRRLQRLGRAGHNQDAATQADKFFDGLFTDAFGPPADNGNLTPEWLMIRYGPLKPGCDILPGWSRLISSSIPSSLAKFIRPEPESKRWKSLKDPATSFRLAGHTYRRVIVTQNRNRPPLSRSPTMCGTTLQIRIDFIAILY